MKGLAVFLACVLAFSIATSADEAILSLQKIEKSRFGKNLLDTVQLQLQTSDAVDRLVSDLENLSADISREQAEDDESNNKLQAECTETIARLNSEIADSLARVQELGAEIEEKTPIFAQKVQTLAEKRDLAVVLANRIAALDAHFEQKTAEFEQEKKEHDQATYVIQRAREVIQGTFVSSSFLQIKKVPTSNLVQVSAHFADTARNTQFKRKSWNSFFRVLSQISASAPIQADAGAIQKILDICSDLLDKIQESIHIETVAYTAFAEDNRAQKDATVQESIDNDGVIANLDAEVTALDHRIKQATQEKSEQEQRAAEKQVELDTRTNFCLDSQKQYEKRTVERNNQLRTVDDVLRIIHNQLRVLKKYVSDRLE